jgi:uncharacterized protein (DUF433 family)
MSEKKVGRPTKYDPEFHPQDIILRMANGEFDSQIAAAWSISRDSLYEWIKTHEEFKEAREIGQPKREAKWIEIGRTFMEKGNKAGFNYWMAFCNNQLGWKSDKEESNVHINNMNLIENKNTQELIDFVKNKINIIDVTPIEYKPDESDGIE